jgi:hypothetical protein
MVILAGISLLKSAADDAGSADAGQSINLSFAEIKSASPQASDIFVVNGTNGND